MPIDQFTKERFEAALPVSKNGGARLWKYAGIRGGEFCYVLPITPNPGVAIFIRSSVRADGIAAGTAEDSIRCWLVDDPGGRSLGSKNARWISRVKGWDRRLAETLRRLWRLGAQLGVCEYCNTRHHALKVKKKGPNLGRWFAACPRCREAGGNFRFHKWLRTEPVPPAAEVSNVAA